MTPAVRRGMLAALVAACVFGFLEWNVSPTTLESRMLSKTARFVGALQTNDRVTVLQLSVSELEALENEQSEDVIRGEFSTKPEVSSAPAPGRSIWDPSMLSELTRYFKSPDSYTLNTDPYTPSIALNFNCAGVTGKCLEHVKFFYTARAGKIDSYVMFWNEAAWRDLWVRHYSEGLVTKPCDDSCPF